MNLFKQSQAPKAPDREAGLAEWFLDDFWPRFGKQTSYALLAIAVIIAGAAWWNSDRVQSQARENKELGPAFVYLGQDRNDSAEAFLSAFVKGSHSRMVLDKANLMLGEILYGKGKYDEAIKAYSQVDLTDTRHALVASGALHGLASCYMQNKNYTAAVDALEKLVDRFGKRTGSPEEKIEGHEKVDLAPSVANALWKLALCYRELKQTDKEKAAAERLVKAYPESRESFEAARLLAQIP